MHLKENKITPNHVITKNEIGNEKRYGYRENLLLIERTYYFIRQS